MQEQGFGRRSSSDSQRDAGQEHGYAEGKEYQPGPAKGATLRSQAVPFKVFVSSVNCQEVLSNI